MKIAIYTLTRDRLDYTERSFESLAKNAGCAYDHFVVDNGSEDGTVVWLKHYSSKFKSVILNAENKGISGASNQALEKIFKTDDYDLIIKMDNDCLVVSENILGQVAEIYEDIPEHAAKHILSPYVKGINNQPMRARYIQYAGRRIGLTGMVGGLFHIVPVGIYKDYRYPEKLPKAWGQDDHFCNSLIQKGCNFGYIEGLIVEHMDTTDGQAKKYPEYFVRKAKEEKL